MRAADLGGLGIVLKRLVGIKPQVARDDPHHPYIAGGAGYGDPLDRDPAAVLADLLDGKISTTTEYGVVLTPDGTAVDEVQTKKTRDALRGAR